MARRAGFWGYVALFGIALLIAGLAGWMAAKKAATTSPPAQSKTVSAAVEETRQLVHLYFSDTQGRYLTAEQQIMQRPPEDLAFSRRLLEALIKGPQKGGGRTLPPEAGIRAIYLVEDGTAVVDFTSEAFVHHPGGIGAELLSVYSIVNTLILNIEAIRAVKLLIGGNEVPVLADHVDLTERFPANMMWVR